MKQFEIGENDAGGRLDKYIHRILKEASAGFLYKMLRKKNITLNGRKAEGSELLAKGDVVRLFLSDETFHQFAGSAVSLPDAAEAFDLKPHIVYEDEHLLLLNKPVGMLSQKAEAGDVSINEVGLAYLKKTGAYHPERFGEFKPSICNRLDRNTSGLLLIGKTRSGFVLLSDALRERTIQKYYYCIVKGVIRNVQQLRGYLIKDERTNQVGICKELPAGLPEKEKQRYQPIQTAYRPLSDRGTFSLLSVQLITGKTHQIRAHLASIGHPLLGDFKYGDAAWNRQMRVESQLLHAYRMELPELEPPLSKLSGKVFELPLPEEFKRIMEN